MVAAAEAAQAASFATAAAMAASQRARVVGGDPAASADKDTCVQANVLAAAPDMRAALQILLRKDSNMSVKDALKVKPR